MLFVFRFTIKAEFVWSFKIAYESDSAYISHLKFCHFSLIYDIIAFPAVFAAKKHFSPHSVAKTPFSLLIQLQKGFFSKVS